MNRSIRRLHKILNSLSTSIIALNDRPEIQKYISIFQRKRKLPLPELIRFLLFLDKQSIPSNLRQFFSQAQKRPSAPAVCKRRKLLDPAILACLFSLVNKQLDLLTPCSQRYYHKKYTLLACDGSDLVTLPNPDDPDAYFSSPNQTKHNIYHLNSLFNLCTGRIESICIHPRRVDNERASFLTMAQSYAQRPSALFLLDRGYECWDIIVQLTLANNFFVLRVQAPCAHGILSGFDLPMDQPFDITQTVFLETRKCAPSLLRPEGCRYAPVSHPTALSVTVRMVSVTLSNGSQEYLLTNLPKTAFSHLMLGRLYRLRWKIETAFRQFKWSLQNIFFHSKQRQKILQELWAKLIMFNICSTIQKIGSAQIPRTKYRYQLSFKRIAEEYHLYLHHGIRAPDFLENIQVTLSPVRPRRSFPRKVRAQGPKSFQYR